MNRFVICNWPLVVELVDENRRKFKLQIINYELLMKRVCIIGCGAIGSLYAAHLARVAEVWAFVRRNDHARNLRRDGLRVTGTHNFSVTLNATTNPAELPDCDFAIVATKAIQVAESFRAVGGHFDHESLFTTFNMGW